MRRDQGEKEEEGEERHIQSERCPIYEETFIKGKLDSMTVSKASTSKCNVFLLLPCQVGGEVSEFFFCLRGKRVPIDVVSGGKKTNKQTNMKMNVNTNLKKKGGIIQMRLLKEQEKCRILVLKKSERKKWQTQQKEISSEIDLKILIRLFCF